MSIYIRIIAHANLVYVRYAAMASPASALLGFDSYVRSKDFVPLQHHLVDLSAVRDYERDYASVMKLTARLIEAAPSARAVPVMGIYAPTQTARAFAQLGTPALRSSNRLAVFMDDDESRLLETMGLRARSIAELLGSQEVEP